MSTNFWDTCSKSHMLQTMRLRMILLINWKNGGGLVSTDSEVKHLTTFLIRSSNMQIRYFCIEIGGIIVNRSCDR